MILLKAHYELALRYGIKLPDDLQVNVLRPKTNWDFALLCIDHIARKSFLPDEFRRKRNLLERVSQMKWIHDLSSAYPCLSHYCYNHAQLGLDQSVSHYSCLWNRSFIKLWEKRLKEIHSSHYRVLEVSPQLNVHVHTIAPSGQRLAGCVSKAVYDLQGLARYFYKALPHARTYMHCVFIGQYLYAKTVAKRSGTRLPARRGRWGIPRVS